MASIDSLKASDGSGNASVATVQNARSALATTIVVDTVQGINTNFHATMGTPHTFVDPVTSEEITIISEATAVDFKGHVDGSNLEIDTIAPGYTDAGSEVGDIVIIKPTTQWADEVADVLEVAHDDDGTLKDDSISADSMFVDALNPVTRADETFGDFVSSGLLVTDDTGLTADLSAGVAYINGIRLEVAAELNHTYTASKDTYVDLGSDGVVDYNEETNGAASPALAANHIRLAKVVTNGTDTTSVVTSGIDSLGNSIYNNHPHYAQKIFTATGTWTKPAYLKFAIVEVQAGGAAGGGAPLNGGSGLTAGGGGGGGGYSRSKILAADLGATETVTVGAGGTGTTGSGGAGGASSFGAHAVAAGATGGATRVGVGFSAINAGGTVSAGDIQIHGSQGNPAIILSATSQVSGAGGDSVLGAGGRGIASNSGTDSDGNVGLGYGGGGSGGLNDDNTSASSGGDGAAGIVIVHEYY